MSGKASHHNDRNDSRPALLDTETVARLRSLAADVAEQDEGVLSELFETFQKDAIARLERLRHANEKDLLREVAATLHSLKGASVTIGVAHLAELCGRFETDLDSTNAALPEAALHELESCRDESLAALRDAFFRDTE